LELAISIAVVALALSLFSLLISIGSAGRMVRLERRLSPTGLPAGSAVPREVFASLFEATSVEGWLKGPTLLVLASPSCEPCRDLIELLNEKPADAAVRLVVVEPESEASHSLQGLARFAASWKTDSTGMVRAAFQTQASPHSFLISDGRVIQQIVGPNIDTMIGIALSQTALR